jgi:hypothetical protein
MDIVTRFLQYMMLRAALGIGLLFGFFWLAIGPLLGVSPVIGMGIIGAMLFAGVAFEVMRTTNQQSRRSPATKEEELPQDNFDAGAALKRYLARKANGA